MTALFTGLDPQAAGACRAVRLLPGEWWCITGCGAWAEWLWESDAGQLLPLCDTDRLIPTAEPE